MRKTEWIAFATLMFTVIGAAWWTGARMATKEGLAVLRQEIRLEIQTLREHVDAQMAELRGYVVDHMNGHPSTEPHRAAAVRPSRSWESAP